MPGRQCTPHFKPASGEVTCVDLSRRYLTNEPKRAPRGCRDHPSAACRLPNATTPLCDLPGRVACAHMLTHCLRGTALCVRAAGEMGSVGTFGRWMVMGRNGCVKLSANTTACNGVCVSSTDFGGISDPSNPL